MYKEKNLVSIVIAVKDPRIEDLRLCLSSFAALENASILDVVIISTESLLNFEMTMISVFCKFSIVVLSPEGIYSAYNAGAKIAVGKYVLFFGIDDIALPGMDVALKKISMFETKYHMLAASCYMQSSGLSHPSRNRKSLILQNWCHQGLFYLREYIVENPYEIEYAIQADHKMNIDIISNKNNKFLILKEVVAYFSASGVSSARPDLKFRACFPNIVKKSYGWTYWIIVIIKQKIVDLLLGKPEKRFDKEGMYRK